MFTLVVFVAGAFVGWNFPQPQFAKDLQDKVIAWINKTDSDA